MSDTDKPETSQEALQLARDWAEGRRSWNNMMDMYEPERRLEALARIAEMDAAEVVKWSAIAVALDRIESEAQIRWHLTGGRA